jgi:hypothetical protein
VFGSRNDTVSSNPMSVPPQNSRLNAYWRTDARRVTDYPNQIIRGLTRKNLVQSAERKRRKAFAPQATETFPPLPYRVVLRS